ncbi:unnamed protein product [Rotaria sp. Silwood2]|nr:unnamed protein product [Rotaria sp. Silwood2]
MSRRTEDDEEINEYHFEERKQFQEQLQELEKEMNTYKQQRDRANEEIREAQIEIEKLEEQEKNCTKRLQELDEQIQHLNEEIARLEAQINALSAEKERIEDERDRQQQLLDQQEDVLEKQIEKLQDLQDKIREYEEQLENLAEEQEKLERAKQELEARINELNRQIQHLEQEIKETKAKIQQLQQEIDRLQQEIERIEEDLQKTLHDIQRVEQEIRQTREKFSQLERQQETLKIEIDRIEDLIIRIENVIEMKRNQKEEFEALKQQLQNEINELKQRHAQIQAEVQRLQQEVQTEKASFQSLIDQAAQMKSEMAALQKEQHALTLATQLLKQNLEAKQHHLTQSKQQEASLDQNLKEKEEAINQFEQDKMKMEEKLKQDTNELNRTQQEFQKSEVERNQCRATLNQEKNNLQSRQATLANEQKKQTQAENNLRQQEQATKKAEQQVQDCEKAAQDAEKAVNQAQQTVEETQRDLQQAEEQLQFAEVALDTLLTFMSANPLVKVVGLAAAKALVSLWKGKLNTKRSQLQQNQQYHQKKVQEHTNAKQKLVQARQTLEQEKSNLTKRQQELTQQKQQVQTASTRLNEQKNFVTNLTSKYSQIQNQTQNLKTQLNNQTKQVEQQQANINTQNIRLTTLKNQLNQVQNKKDQVAQRCAQLFNDVGQLNEQHQAQTQNLNNYNQKLEANQQKQDALTSQIEQKQKKIQNLEQQTAAKANEEATLRGKITNAEENIRMLNKSVSELENDKRIQQKLLRDTQQQKITLENESSRLDHDIKKLIQDSERLENDQRRLERELKNHTKQILDRTKQQQNLKFELQQKQDNLSHQKQEKNNMEQQKDQLITTLERNKSEQKNIKKKVAELNREVINHERAKQVTEQKVNDARNKLRNIIQELDRLNKSETDLKNQSNTLRDKQDTLIREHDSIDDKKRHIDRNLSLAKNKKIDNEREVTSLSGKMASKENLVRTLRRVVDGNKSSKEKRSDMITSTDSNTDDVENFDKRRHKQYLINDDEKNLKLLRLCIAEETIENAKIEIRQQYYKEEDRHSSSKKHSSSSTKENPTPASSKLVSIDEINCLIQMKINHEELKKFFQNFLLRSLDQPVSSKTRSTINLENNIIHPLNHRCILDLFIRKQMAERGMIDFGRERPKFRLVEPITLNDEFDTWYFDHFHSLFDLFLTRPNNESFPIRWELIEQSKITYQIISVYSTNDSDRKPIQRPSTKSLEKFIEDICQIEDNGMASNWIELLRKEDIITYAHLTNLNQKEWDNINKLSMNALKTIKTYVDREKQTAEDQTKTNKRKNESESEILAKIHMIKLYFSHALQNEEGIVRLSKLDARCVTKAFEEMRQDYEDDGLFDEMIQFFLPLTVTDHELVLDANEIHLNTEEKRRTQNQYEREIQTLIRENGSIVEDIESRKTILGQIKEERQRLFEELESDLKEIKMTRLTSYAREKNDLEKKWSRKDTIQSDRSKEIKKKIEQMEILHKANEALIKDKRNLLNTIIDDLNNQQTHIDNKLVKPHRGFIMYGPPGTGKSHIMSQLAKKIGIAMLGPPLAAGELERPLVGQSEAVILDLCSRGNRLPYLMCCVSIDEIDSLAPRRDEDSSEGKVAKISVLLSVLEGIKDVPNLMFFSATNRLHMMDEAFLRRMSGKFFVGRPSSEARRRILNAIPRNMVDPSLREKLASATTNFSGAALSALNRSIAVHFIAQRRTNKIYKIEYEEALLQADRTARQYQIFLGLDTLPRLLKRNYDSAKRSGTSQNSNDTFHLKDNCHFTGKIIISLSNQSARIEYIDLKRNNKKVYEDNLNRNEENVQQLLERITNYGNDRNVQLLQLIDLNLLSSKGAYDEKKIFETLKERYDECMEYKRSMIIYDLDSLIGVNQSESQSSMGTSTSSSVVHQALYIYVTSRFREAVIETNNKSNVEKWSIAVVRDSFLLKKFSQDVEFPKTDREEEEYKEEQRKEKELIKCIKCRDFFIENENKMGNCTYHDGFVYDNLSLELTKYTPSMASEILNRDEFEMIRYPQRKDEIDRRKGRFKYICCDSTVQSTIGSSAGGCKKGKHAMGVSLNKQKRSRMLTKDDIDQWENFCMENDEYNERWSQLFTNRSKGGFK